MVMSQKYAFLYLYSKNKTINIAYGIFEGEAMRKKVSKDYINDVENFDKLPVYSKRIRYYLDEKHITAKELNQKAGFSSPNVVPSLIKGERELSLDAAKKLCSVMNVSLDYLTGLTDVKTTDVKIVDMCKATGLTEKAIKAILDGNNSKMAIGYEEKFLQWLNRRALSDFIVANYGLSQSGVFRHISEAYQHSGEACNILLRAIGAGGYQNSLAREESLTEKQRYDISIYFAQKMFAEWLDAFCKKTNGSANFNNLWEKSVDETTREWNALSEKERQERFCKWLSGLKECEANIDGKHNKTNK